VPGDSEPGAQAARALLTEAAKSVRFLIETNVEVFFLDICIPHKNKFILDKSARLFLDVTAGHPMNGSVIQMPAFLRAFQHTMFQKIRLGE
jgi:hypothetical protein